MNLRAVGAIYAFEMSRFFRTLLQSFVSPVISTSLYFVVFGAAIGSRIDRVEGVDYGAFIVPGLIMLSVMTQAITNASFGIYFPKFIGTIFELLSAPVNFLEVVLGYVGAAATKALFIGVVILATSSLFVDLRFRARWRWWPFCCSPACPLRFSGSSSASGRELRTTAAGSAAGHHAAGVSGRLVLLDLDAAARLADGHAVQPGGLPDFGLSLVVLRAGGCAGGAESHGHRASRASASVWSG